LLDQKNHIFVSSGGFVDEYDATTGATINAHFVSGLGTAQGMALDAALNHLFVGNNFNGVAGVSEYDATTGALLNAAFINFPGPFIPYGLTLDNHGHLFVGNATPGGPVAEYDATTGATINSAFISGFAGSPLDVLFVASLPEPSSLLLLAAGVGGIIRRKSASRLARKQPFINPR